MAFPGTDMDYDASLDEVLDLPFVGAVLPRCRAVLGLSLTSAMSASCLACRAYPKPLKDGAPALQPFQPRIVANPTAVC